VEEAPSELDLGRLEALGPELGQTGAQVARTLADELRRAFADMDAALGTGDLDAAGHAVHAARNSALMIAADPMIAGLRALDRALGAGDLAGARAVRARLDDHRSAVDAALHARA
jgi:hypothetical protein